MTIKLLILLSCVFRGKRLLFFGLIVLSFNTNSQQIFVHEYVPRELKSIWFTNSNTGFIVGEKGAFKKTIDGGTTWKWIKLTNHNLTKIAFFSSKIGIVGGDSIILRTTDGGNKWSYLPSKYYLTDFSFVNEKDGFAIDTNGVVLKTDDAGVSWTEIKNLGFTQAKAIFFINTSIGYATGNKYVSTSTNDIWKTIDGGVTWTKILGTTNAYVSDIWFTDLNVGYSSTTTGIIQKTTDGGNTWTKQVNNDKFTINSLQFTDSNNGLAFGVDFNTPLILKTTNGGTSWLKQSSDVLGVGDYNYARLNEGLALANTIFCVGNQDLIYKSSNAGSTWVNLSGFGTASSTYFFNENVGLAVGKGIFKTIDGGKTWRVVTPNLKYFTTPSPNTYSNFWGASQIQFTTPNVGYICGSSGGVGALWKTTDQGENWQKIDETGGYLDLDFVDQNNGFFSYQTYYTYLRKTGDAGTTLGAANPQINYGPIDFISTTTGFYVSGGASIFEDEKIWKTTNEGTTWTSVLTIQATENQDISSIRFLDANKGFVVGNNGAIYRTTDGGNNWVQYNGSTTSERLKDIAFFDSNVGFIVGEQGSILKTTDGGSTWSLESSKLTTIGSGVYNGNGQPVNISGDGRQFMVANSNGFVATGSVSFCKLSFTPVSPKVEATYLCGSGSATLKASGGLTGNYRWYETETGGNPINGATSSSFTTPLLTESKSYYVSIVNGTYESERAEVLISVLKFTKPTITISAANTEKPVLTSSSTKGNQWYIDTIIPIPGATQQTLEVTNWGIYSVKVTEGICSQSSDNFPVIVTSLKGPNSETILYYPNPVENELIIELPGRSGENNIRILNIEGRLIDQKYTSTNVEKFNTINYPAGLYLLIIQTANSTHYQKFLKK